MSLLELPNEVVVRIAQHVVISERHYSLWQIGELARACKRLKILCHDRAVWRHVCAVLASQCEQTEGWHAYANAYSAAALVYEAALWGDKLPWKRARLPQHYGDTLLCDLDHERYVRLRIAGASAWSWQIEFPSRLWCIASIKRDANGRAKSFIIYAQIPLREASPNFYAIFKRMDAKLDFGWRPSKCVPREFWCSGQFTMTLSIYESPKYKYEAVRDDGMPVTSSYLKRKWIKHYAVTQIVES